MKQFLIAFIILISANVSGIAQSDDQILPLNYVPQEILNEWKLYSQGEAAVEVAEMTKAFMAEFEVPQTGLYGFNLDDTWYMWISNNPEKINYYIDRKRAIKQ